MKGKSTVSNLSSQLNQVAPMVMLSAPIIFLYPCLLGSALIPIEIPMSMIWGLFVVTNSLALLGVLLWVKRNWHGANMSKC